MAANMPLGQTAGADFDRFFDWNGATSTSDSSYTDTKHLRQQNNTVLPISPLSVTHNDFDNSTTVHPQFLTAPSGHDLPTPSHSSSSPEGRSSIDLRYSGESLREQVPVTRPLKRKISPNEVPFTITKRDEPTPVAKKRPHNIIEKRYRANLNEKIAELRDAVPSLRITKKAQKSGGESDDEDLDGLAASNKLNKASILTKAVEYIRHLEVRSNRLEDENTSLKDRLQTLEKVIAQGAHSSDRASAFTSEATIEQPVDDGNHDDRSPSQEQSTSQPVRGLISMPDSWRRLRQGQSQDHYGHIYDSPSQRSFVKGKWPARIMVGSLATLMVMEGFSESDQGTPSREKGLFGIPLELLDGWKFLRSPRLYLATFSQFCQAGGIIPLIKGFMALTILAFIIFAYLFNSKPTPKEDLEGNAAATPQTAAPASPIEVRRRAWSTSMQALRLPHHSFFPEWTAVTAEWLKYTIRYVFGYQAYLWVTGRSIDDDAARVKAWDIAIDAQLAGGDVEVSRSRVVLTSYGSGTLPRTPLRLMQKSLHCRVLLANVGSQHGKAFKLANTVGKFFANREWHQARRYHERLSATDPERLPNNLAALLSMDCDDVFTDVVVQRAYNLMYNRPTQEQAEDCLMDVVVEDHAIRSPLDAVAAWRSTVSLRKAFETSLQCPGELGILQEHLDLALMVAPPGTAAETRALAGHALFSPGSRNAFHTRASEMLLQRCRPLSPSDDAESRGPYFIDSSTPASARADLQNCLHCAKTLIIFNQEMDVEGAQAFFTSVPMESANTTLLTLAAVKAVLFKIPELEGLNNRPASAASSNDTCVAEDCHVQISPPKRRQSNVSNDTGYESMEEPASRSSFEEMLRCSVGI